jgi:D-threo-aldose 1-dehydrogenase
VLERVRRIEAIAIEYAVPLAAAAIRFALAHPATSAAVLGATSAAEVEANIRSYRHPIPDAFWTAVRSAGLLPAAVPLPGGTS